MIFGLWGRAKCQRRNAAWCSNCLCRRQVGGIRNAPSLLPIGGGGCGAGGEEACGGVLAEKGTVSAEEATGGGETEMGFDGVGEERDVAVGKDEIVAGGGTDGEVARGGETVPVLLLPHEDALQRRCLRMGAHRSHRVGIGAVVGHDHLVRPTRLRRQRREHQAEVLGAVVDGGDDADFHAASASFFGGHAQASARAGSKNCTSRIRLSG